MRQCPNAHSMFGRASIWDVTTTEFNWIIEQLADENKTLNRKKKK